MVRPPGKFACVLQSPLLVAIVIAAVTLAVFIHLLSADFVMWDDDRMVYNNPQLTGLNIERLGQIFTHRDVTRRYTPLAALNYSIVYQLCRLNPFGYHLSPWLFHGLNAAIVFFLLRILLIKGFSWHHKHKSSENYYFSSLWRTDMVPSSVAYRTGRLGRSRLLSPGNVFYADIAVMLPPGKPGEYQSTVVFVPHPHVSSFFCRSDSVASNSNWPSRCSCCFGCVSARENLRDLVEIR